MIHAKVPFVADNAKIILAEGHSVIIGNEIKVKKESLIFVPDGVPSHPSLACEAALMTSVRAPKVSDDAAISLVDLAKSLLLSPLQLEGVFLAISRHEKLVVPMHSFLPRHLK